MINLKLKRGHFNGPYYPYLYQYNVPEEIYFGGSGSGKSHFIAQKILIKALTDQRKVLIVRKYLSSQKDSCWSLFLQLLNQWCLTAYSVVKSSEYKIQLPNDSILLFKGLDDPEKIKSITGITDIWCEEATELTAEEYDQLKLRLRANKPDLQIFLSFNPISKANWVYKRFFQDKTDAFILKTTYKDNAFLPELYKEQLEKMIETNPTYYRIYALGEFCSLDKLIYTNWEIGTREMTGELCCGLDFGFTIDTTAFVASLINNDELYIFKTWGTTGKTNPEIAEAITSLGFAKSTIICDSAEPKSIEELKRAGLQRAKASKKGPDSIVHGIQQVQQYKIVVNPECKELITELENYSWQRDKASGEYINKPIDDFNHYLDALRYSLQCVQSKIKILNKSLLGV